LFVAILLGLLTFCKEGSGLHYFFESVLLLSILVPALAANKLNRRIYPIDVVLVLCIMLFAGQLFQPRSPQPYDIAQHNALQSYLRRNFPPQAPALSPYPGDLFQAGLQAPFSGLFELARFARPGVVSDRGLVAQIRDRHFAVIVWHFDISKERDPYRLKFYATPAILRAIETEYELDASLEMPTPIRQSPDDRFYVYVPRFARADDKTSHQLDGIDLKSVNKR
jgi:hypothetical protein